MPHLTLEEAIAIFMMYNAHCFGRPRNHVPSFRAIRAAGLLKSSEDYFTFPARVQRPRASNACRAALRCRGFLIQQTSTSHTYGCPGRSS